MARYTITHVIKAIKAAFPGVEFTYASGGQGRRKAVTVGWTGDPPPADVSAAFPVQMTREQYQESLLDWGLRELSPREQAAYERACQERFNAMLAEMHRKPRNIVTGGRWF